MYTFNINGATAKRFEKFSLNFFNSVVCNPCQPSSSLTIDVALWFINPCRVFQSL